MKIYIIRNPGGIRYLRRLITQREEREENRELKRAAAARLREIERSTNRWYKMSEQLPAVINLETIKEVDLTAAWRK